MNFQGIGAVFELEALTDRVCGKFSGFTDQNQPCIKNICKGARKSESPRFDGENFIKPDSLYFLSHLIDRLLEVEDVFVVLAGVDPAPEASALFKNERCLRLIGKTTVEELFALFHVSHVLVSHECGLVQLASLTPIPIIAFFGPETPSLYGPLTEHKTVFYKNFMCSPCLSAFNYRRSVCKDNRCLQAISIDEVYKEILAVICPPSLLPMR